MALLVQINAIFDFEYATEVTALDLKLELPVDRPTGWWHDFLGGRKLDWNTGRPISEWLKPVRNQFVLRDEFVGSKILCPLAANDWCEYWGLVPVNKASDEDIIFVRAGDKLDERHIPFAVYGLRDMQPARAGGNDTAPV